MNPYIRDWVKKICTKHGFSAFYLPERDTYLIHFKGRALQGFNSNVFYQIPKVEREKGLIGILKRGLMLNINEAHRAQLYTQRRLGKEIVA